jgi:hypothetical protein
MFVGGAYFELVYQAKNRLGCAPTSCGSHPALAPRDTTTHAGRSCMSPRATSASCGPAAVTSSSRDQVTPIAHHRGNGIARRGTGSPEPWPTRVELPLQELPHGVDLYGSEQTYHRFVPSGSG